MFTYKERNVNKMSPLIVKCNSYHLEALKLDLVGNLETFVLFNSISKTLRLKLRGKVYNAKGHTGTGCVRKGVSFLFMPLRKAKFAIPKYDF